MSKKKEEPKIISISLSQKNLQSIEEALSDMGYMSRSELIRDAVRYFLNEKVQLEKIKGSVEGIITILYDHSVVSKVSQIRHEYTHVLKSFMHSDFNAHKCSCCEVILFSGQSSDIRKAYNKLRSIKGVEEAHIYIASEQ
jgi:metal-responsive CopG/Arc/MetJ family transcriptional regulator